MKRSTLTALFSAVTILLVAGVVHSDSHVAGNVTLMDFEEDTDTLLGYPDGTPPLGWFVRTVNTQHVPGLVDPQAPPNPCRGLTRAWNRIVMKVPATGQREALTNVLGQMASHSCRANIVRDENVDPAVIISIEPTP